MIVRLIDSELLVYLFVKATDTQWSLDPSLFHPKE